VQIDRTTPYNKPDIIIRDTEKGTGVLKDAAISGERNMIRKKAEKILTYKDLITNSAHVECESKSDTSNSTGN